MLFGCRAHNSTRSDSLITSYGGATTSSSGNDDAYRSARKASKRGTLRGWQKDPTPATHGLRFFVI